MLKRVLGCLLFAVAIAPGQQQWFNAASPQQPSPASNPNAKRYPVSGTVVNALTGAPIPRAVVQLQGPEPARAITGDDGHFEIKDVLEGRYVFDAHHPGFLSMARSKSAVAVGATTPSVECKLLPQGSLRGRIVNSDGEPVEDVGVQILRSTANNGRRDWQMAGAARSDETGVFVFENLSSGSYLVHTEPHQVFASSSEIVVDGRHYPELYLPQYFPNSPDRSSAQPVELQPGGDSEADFSLTAVPAYQVSGTVGEVRRYGASCENADGDIVSSEFRADNRTGKFTLSRLPAGTCTLVVRSGFGQESQSLYAELPIDIKNSDIDGLRLSLQPLPDIQVTVAGGANTADNPGAQLQLIPQHSGGRHQGSQAEKRGDAFAFRAVTPGTYTLSAFPFGSSCLGGVTSGSTNLLHDDLTVMAGSAPGPITVTIRNDCGSISGKLPDNAGPSNVFIVAVPDGAPLLGKMGFSNNGSFQIANLTPGDYTVYAFTDLQNAPYADPQFLKTVEGQKITIAPNDKPTISINKVNDTGMGQ